jgi:hypothetical protein
MGAALIGWRSLPRPPQGATTVAFIVLWLLAASSPRPQPARHPGGRLPASAVALLTAWTAATGALAGLAWHTVVH